MSTDVKYPIGRFEPPVTTTPEERAARISVIEALPGEMRTLVAALPDAELKRTYRPGGWSIRQLVHHVAESHMNAFIRTKFALAEDAPAVKPYNEAVWADMADKAAPVEASLQLLAGLHQRWVTLLRGQPEAAFARTMRHPEFAAPLTLDHLVALYAWHSRHHTAHVRAALNSPAPRF